MTKRISQFDLIVWVVIFVLVGAIALTVMLAERDDRLLRVAFLMASQDGNQNIWLAYPHDPDIKEQITFSEMGVFDYTVSPDGRSIVYAETYDTKGLAGLSLINPRTRQMRTLVDCQAEDSDCKNPVFSPNGQFVAYERVALNTAFPNIGPGALRIWLVDMRSSTVGTRPVTEGPEIRGHSPVWSGNSNFVAFHTADFDNPGIYVYDVTANGSETTPWFIPSYTGATVTQASDGDQFFYLERQDVNGQIVTTIKIADLSTRTFTDLSLPQDKLVNYAAASWTPDNERLTVSRSHVDNRLDGYQLYFLEPTNGMIDPLVVDENYDSRFFAWDETGTMLLIQRNGLIKASGGATFQDRPEVWTYDKETDELLQIVYDATDPQWVP